MVRGGLFVSVMLVLPVFDCESTLLRELVQRTGIQVIITVLSVVFF